LIEFDPFDLDAVGGRLAAFMRAQGLADVSIGALTRYTVGFSWVTYGLRAGWRENGAGVERELILRVGPPTGIFGPYRASPEFVTLSALNGSGVPVPAVYWYDDTGEWLGAPFFVCEKVSGTAPIPWTHDGGPAFDDARREALGAQFVAALAALHRFEWRDTPVASIGGPTDPTATALERLDYWEARMREWSDWRYPSFAWAIAWLRENAPVAPRISIVHGDFRIGNFLEEGGRITAMLDWELVSLGDPVEDLGWICLQAWRGRSPHMCHFFSREELRDRYAELSGIDVPMSAIRYWEAFGTFKLAVMHLGATYSFEKRGFNDLRMAGMTAQLPRMLLQLGTALERAA
jgi:aminoglycoside phosphotransferase (APT) family kinase protein